MQPRHRWLGGGRSAKRKTMDLDLVAADELASASERGGVFAQIEAIERSSFPDDESLADHIRFEAKGRARTLLIARPRADTSVVWGYLLFERSAIVAHIMKLAVAEKMRRQGVGRALLAEAVRRVRKPTRGRTSSAGRPVSAMTLHVDPKRTGAVALYASMGFREDSRKVDYYCAGRDAILLQLDLTSHVSTAADLPSASRFRGPSRSAGAGEYP